MVGDDVPVQHDHPGGVYRAKGTFARVGTQGRSHFFPDTLPNGTVQRRNILVKPLEHHFPVMAGACAVQRFEKAVKRKRLLIADPICDFVDR